MSFANKLKGKIKKSKEKRKKLVRQSTFALFSDIIKGTAVDKGTARNNWFTEIGAPSRQVDEKADKSGNIKTGEALSILRNWNQNSSVYFVNNLPYAKRLEYGSSKQAPQGMVRINVAKWEQFFKDNL